MSRLEGVGIRVGIRTGELGEERWEVRVWRRVRKAGVAVELGGRARSVVVPVVAARVLSAGLTPGLTTH